MTSNRESASPAAAAERQPEIYVILGHGGVGKTTVCAGLSLALASQGRRVVALTIDPARRLAESLGIDSDRVNPTPLGPERLAQAGFPEDLSVSALVLDPKHTFDTLIARYASSDRVRQRITANPWYDYVSRNVAGVHEYMAIERLYALIESRQFDTIVVDTPPADNALAFLDAPARLSEVLDQSALKWILKAFEPRRGLNLNLLTRGIETMVRSLASITGARFLQGFAQLASDLDDLFGGLDRRAQSMERWLHAPSCHYLLVTTLDEVNLSQVQDLGAALAARGIEALGVVLNRVSEQVAEFSNPAMREALAPHLASLEAADALVQAIAEAVHAQRQLCALENARLDRHMGESSGLRVVARIPDNGSEYADLKDLRPLSQLLLGFRDLTQRVADRGIAPAPERG